MTETTTATTPITNCAEDTPKEMASIADTLNTVVLGVANAKDDYEKSIAEETPRILEKYGITELRYGYQASELVRAEREIAICEKCVGLPCVRGNTGRPFISVEQGADGKSRVEIRYGLCKYQKARNEMRRLDKAFKAAKIPPQYRDKTFADYEVTADNAQAVKAAKEFLASGTGGLLFYGEPGTGKTFLASIVVQEFLKTDKTAIFGDVPTLLEILKSSFEDKNTKITDLMNDLSTVDLLVLDDLGTERPTEWAVERIYLVINQRYNEEKPVIVTSNYFLGELAQRLDNPKNANGLFKSVTGKRIVSRLAQMCTRVEIKGKDRRI